MPPAARTVPTCQTHGITASLTLQAPERGTPPPGISGLFARRPAPRGVSTGAAGLRDATPAPLRPPPSRTGHPDGHFGLSPNVGGHDDPETPVNADRVRPNTAGPRLPSTARDHPPFPDSSTALTRVRRRSGRRGRGVGPGVPVRGLETIGTGVLASRGGFRRAVVCWTSGFLLREARPKGGRPFQVGTGR